MAFDEKTWKEKIKERLTDWKGRMERAGVNSAYAFISAATLWPVVEAAKGGEWAALTALGGCREVSFQAGRPKGRCFEAGGDGAYPHSHGTFSHGEQEK